MFFERTNLLSGECAARLSEHLTGQQIRLLGGGDEVLDALAVVVVGAVTAGVF